jgi:hypothetical protein
MKHPAVRWWIELDQVAQFDTNGKMQQQTIRELSTADKFLLQCALLIVICMGMTLKAAVKLLATRIGRP